jgi:phosphoglycolate phosphatase-like HAD superfamily hydrolase
VISVDSGPAPATSATSACHLVWDWNGTLLDDLPIVVESVNVGLAAYGGSPIDADGYRTHYTRPVNLFYERLLGRSVTDAEWIHINELFHQAYFSRVGAVGLAPDAGAALDVARGRGLHQSVLSMAPHDHLVGIVDRLGVAGYFEVVRGSQGNRGAEKADSLAEHLDALGLAPATVVVVGDVPDDAAAAEAVGAKAVLFDGGSHHRHDLEAVGVPVAESLVLAVELALEEVAAC